MRFLLDTNILIPLEDSQRPLVPSLTSFVRLANLHGHVLLYHPASEDDIREDRNVERRDQTLQRLAQYVQLDARPVCPWNAAGSRVRDMNLAESQALEIAQDLALDRFEADHRFTAQDICDLHALWLGPIYPWAGEYRSVDIGKGGFQFAHARLIQGLEYSGPT